MGKFVEAHTNGLNDSVDGNDFLVKVKFPSSSRAEDQEAETMTFTLSPDITYWNLKEKVSEKIGIDSLRFALLKDGERIGDWQRAYKTLKHWGVTNGQTLTIYLDVVKLELP